MNFCRRPFTSPVGRHQNRGPRPRPSHESRLITRPYSIRRHIKICPTAHSTRHYHANGVLFSVFFLSFSCFFDYTVRIEEKQFCNNVCTRSFVYVCKNLFFSPEYAIPRRLSAWRIHVRFRSEPSENESPRTGRPAPNNSSYTLDIFPLDDKTCRNRQPLTFARPFQREYHHGQRVRSSVQAANHRRQR